MKYKTNYKLLSVKKCEEYMSIPNYIENRRNCFFQ